MPSLSHKEAKDIFDGIKNFKILRDNYILKRNLCSTFLSKATFSFTRLKMAW